jgi:transposase
MADRPDATLEEVKAELQFPFSVSTLSRALIALRYTFKKKSSGPRNKTGRTSPRSGHSGDRGRPS